MNEWMNSQQCKERFGIGFKELMHLHRDGVIDMSQVGETYLFNVSQVRAVIEGGGENADA